MPGTHNSRPVYATDDAARRWVWKKEMRADDVLAEALGWLLSRALGVPTPDAATVGMRGSASWATELIDAPLHWGQLRGAVLVNPDAVGAMIGLDVLLGNPDRHASNILCVPQPSADELFAYSIDLAASWAGDPKGFDAKALDVPTVDLVIPPEIPVDLIRAGAYAFAQRAQDLPVADVRSYVAEACDLVDDPDAALLDKTLQRRITYLGTLLDQYLPLMEAREP